MAVGMLGTARQSRKSKKRGGNEGICRFEKMVDIFVFGEERDAEVYSGWKGEEVLQIMFER